MHAILKKVFKSVFKLHRLEIFSAPSKWIELLDHTEILPSYHLIKVKTSDFEVIKPTGAPFKNNINLIRAMTTDGLRYEL